jgi:short chain dehydrogenase
MFLHRIANAARQLLLLLDNFEQVTEAAPLVATLLGAAPGVVALVTSRTVLRLSGAHEFPVAALPVPQAGTGENAASTRRHRRPGHRWGRGRRSSGGAGRRAGGHPGEQCRQLRPDSLEDATAAIWAQTYNVNVLSGVRMIRRIIEPMRRRGWGRIITIGGGLALQPRNVQPHYNASLTARHNLAVSLARELKGTGVTSNVVSPGAILVDSVRQLVTSTAPVHGWSGTWEQIEAAAHR